MVDGVPGRRRGVEVEVDKVGKCGWVLSDQSKQPEYALAYQKATDRVNIELLTCHCSQ